MELKINTRKYNNYVSRAEVLIINIPAWLFLLLALLCCVTMLQTRGWLRIAFLCLIWWSISGFIMLLIDYKRKYYLYLRMLHKETLSTHTLKKMQDTICGWCLYLSYKYRCSHNKTK